MSNEQKTQPQSRQQSAEIPHAGFGPVRIRAVAAATSVKSKTSKSPESKRELPPLLRKDQFFD